MSVRLSAVRSSRGLERGARLRLRLSATAAMVARNDVRQCGWSSSRKERGAAAVQCGAQRGAERLVARSRAEGGQGQAVQPSEGHGARTALDPSLDASSALLCANRKLNGLLPRRNGSFSNKAHSVIARVTQREQRAAEFTDVDPVVAALDGALDCVLFAAIHALATGQRASAGTTPLWQRYLPASRLETGRG